ncbi:MAG: cytochrome c oxidase subunit 3 [Saprospiraceae bacterium]|nr:cytochrome c oxidase subunit 3 [Saprospiraceae bacterium]
MIRNKTDYIVHPYNVFIALLLSGITIAFFGLSLAYLYSRIQGNIPPVELPPLFYFNCLLLIGSSWTLVYAKKSYKEDDTPRYKTFLLWTLVLTTLFILMQIIAWRQLFDNQIPLQHSTTASFLYVVSGLHFLHVFAGIPFLALFYWKARKKLVEPVSVLVYFSDPDKRRTLNILTVYWHFLDVLWIYLVVFFGINYLLS